MAPEVIKTLNGKKFSPQRNATTVNWYTTECPSPIQSSVFVLHGATLERKGCQVGNSAQWNVFIWSVIRKKKDNICHSHDYNFDTVFLKLLSPTMKRLFRLCIYELLPLFPFSLLLFPIISPLKRWFAAAIQVDLCSVCQVILGKLSYHPHYWLLAKQN